MEIKLSEATKLSHDLKCINAIENRYEKFHKQARYSEKPGYYAKKIDWEFSTVKKQIFELRNNPQKRGNNNKTYILKKIRQFYNKMPKMEEHYRKITYHLCKQKKRYISDTYRRPRVNCKIIKTTLKKLNLAKDEARRYNWIWRTCQELSEAHHNNSLAIFNSLTVEEGNVESVFGLDAQGFQNYIKAINQRVRGEHRYFAVRERGAKGKLHIHTLHVLEGEMPNEWKLDPNYGLQIPYRREIQGFKQLWPYGFSAPIAIRYSDNDAWGNLGWRWPTDRNGVGKEVTKPAQMAQYLAKYLKKLSIKEKDTWPTKRTQNWGLRTLDNILDKMTNRELTILKETTTRKHFQIMGKPIPKTILDRRILNTWKKRQNLHLNQLMAVPAQPNIITLVRSSTQATRTCNLTNTESTETLRSNDTDTSELENKWSKWAKHYLPYDLNNPTFHLKGSTRVR